MIGQAQGRQRWSIADEESQLLPCTPEARLFSNGLQKHFLLIKNKNLVFSLKNSSGGVGRSPTLSVTNQFVQPKDQIILATGRGILADFWVPHEIESWNFQHMLDLWFSEASQNLSSFRQLFFHSFQRGTKGKKLKNQKKQKKCSHVHQILIFPPI